MKKQTQVVQLPIPQFNINDPLIWQYAIHDYKDLDHYLLTNQTFQASLPKSLTIQEACINICKHFSIPMHPSLQVLHLKSQQSNCMIVEQSIDSIANSQAVFQYLTFQNTLIDTLTLRLVQYLWPNYPNLGVLKLYNTQLTESEADLISKIISENKIVKLFIDYVNIVPIIQNPNILQLHLRGNKINGTQLSMILSPNMKQLQVLELSENPFKSNEIQQIANFISQKNQLQYIGLSRNELQWDDLKPLLDQIGSEKLSPQKLQVYRDLEAQREKIQKEKAKKKEVFNEPELEVLISNPDGSFSIQKNIQLNILNLGMNQFKESDVASIEKFILLNPNLTLVLQGSSIETKSKEKLRKKNTNIIL